MRYFILLILIQGISGVQGVSAQDMDSTSIKQIDSLIQISKSYTLKRNFDSAFVLIATADSIAVDHKGKPTLSNASIYFNKGMIYFEKQDYKQSEKYLLQATTIYKNILGDQHPYYANCLKNLSNLYFEIGNYSKAEELNLEEKAIRKNALASNPFEYITCLNNLAGVYQATGKYSNAEEITIEAKVVCEESLGKQHPEYVKILNNLAIIYFNIADYERAEPLFKEAMNIRELSFGRQHPDFAASLNNLALLYETMGNYDLAEPMYLESKSIIEMVYGTEHSDYVMCLHNLSALYWSMGKFEKAEPLNLEAKQIIELTLGKEHPDYANSLNNLATLYQTLGNYAKAELFYLEAVRIREKILGKQHPDYAYSLNSLATLYKQMGKTERAEQLYFEILQIMEGSVGKNHPYYALGMHNLANLYFESSKTDQAEKYFKQAIDIRKKSLGKRHPDYALVLNDLAGLKMSQGKYIVAEKLYKEVLDIQKEALGTEHPNYTNTLKSLAKVYEFQNQFTETEIYLDEFFKMNNLKLAKSITFLSEEELSKYITLENDGDLLSSFIHSRLSKNTSEGILSALNYNQALFQKGFLLGAASNIKKLIGSSPEAVSVNQLLINYRLQLAKEYSSPKSERDSTLIADLEEKANVAEKKLARIVASYNELIRQCKWEDVKNALSQMEDTGKVKVACIEFIHFKNQDTSQSSLNLYAALLLSPDLNQPKFVFLFTESELDSILKQGMNLIQKTESLYASRGVKPMAQNINITKNLYKLLWAPIEKELQNVKSIYFSTSGKLNQLNIGAIPIDNDRILSDKYNLIQLGSTRQLVYKQNINIENQNAVLFGGIQYTADSSKVKVTNFNNSSKAKIENSTALDSKPIIPISSGNLWNYLPGTENEITIIEKALKSTEISARVYRNYEASEEEFKSIGTKNSTSPRIVHLATHGYFFSVDKNSIVPEGKIANKNLINEDTLNSALNYVHVINDKRMPVFKVSNNPLIRSGLILAGANYSWQYGVPINEGMEDGILTAYEISQMNLSNTELVVLSACETGLGDIQGNEGVYGLQRAFKMAGVKYIIMSLWQVPDQQTALLMTTFYKKWLSDKMSIPKAFHAAQKELRDLGLDPYQWAGFVLVE